jgi:hypothetical protein
MMAHFGQARPRTPHGGQDVVKFDSSRHRRLRVTMMVLLLALTSAVGPGTVKAQGAHGEDVRQPLNETNAYDGFFPFALVDMILLGGGVVVLAGLGTALSVLARPPVSQRRE